MLCIFNLDEVVQIEACSTNYFFFDKSDNQWKLCGSDDNVRNYADLNLRVGGDGKKAFKRVKDRKTVDISVPDSASDSAAIIEVLASQFPTGLPDDSPPPAVVYVLKARGDCKGQDADELDFSKGDIITIVKDQDEDGWYWGKLGEKTGMVPESFVEKIEKPV